MQTPVLSRLSHGISGAASHSGTPQVAGSTQEKDDEGAYIATSKMYNANCGGVSFERLLELLGEDWKKAWNCIYGSKGEVDIKRIGDIYAQAFGDKRLKLSRANVNEETYQAAFDALATAEDQPKASPKFEPGMHWIDMHGKRIKRSDGTYQTPSGSFTGLNKRCALWKYFSVVVEIEGDSWELGE
ncbi:hypothetical protein IWW40_005692 [Coemansia sp. RSA 1250]|nr:hypothetical protein IWW40_005692 [Coemansia sp. RSA 1250]